MAGQLTLVLGGVRSGKSAFAESLLTGDEAPVIYVATGQATDQEMARRIRLHQERRPAHWQTVEAPLDPGRALSGLVHNCEASPSVLVDSLDVWVANVLLSREAEEAPVVEVAALEELDELLAACRGSGTAGSSRAVLVSSEVGLSPVPPNALGRQFQDLLGTVNQRAAAAADDVYLVVAGIPVQIKPQ